MELEVKQIIARGQVRGYDWELTREEMRELFSFFFFFFSLNKLIGKK